MCCTFADFKNLFARRSRRHPARRLSYGQQSESLEPRVVLSAVSPAGAVDAVVADGGDTEVRADAEPQDAFIYFEVGGAGTGDAGRSAFDPVFQGGVRVAASDGSESSRSGDDEAEDSIVVDYGAIKIEYSRGEDVLISSYQSSGSAGGDSLPQDSFSINFAKIETYPADASGRSGGSGNDTIRGACDNGCDDLERGLPGGDVLISSYQSSGSAGGDVLPGVYLVREVVPDGFPQDDPLIGFNFTIEIQTTPGSAGGDSIPQDSFSLNFTKIETYPSAGIMDGETFVITVAGNDFGSARSVNPEWLGDDLIRGDAGDSTMRGALGDDELFASDDLGSSDPGPARAPINYGDFNGPTVEYLDVVETGGL